MFWRFCAGALLLVSIAATAQSSVWLVSKGNDQLLIGGTVHLLPPAQYPLPDEFAAAYQQSDVVVLETDLRELADADNATLMQQHLLYPAGTKLSSKLSAKTLQRLQPLLQQNKLSQTQVDQFKPGMLVTQLTLLELQRQGFSAVGVDQYFLTQAQQQKKTLRFLETVDFQFKLLGDLGAGREEQFFAYALNDVDKTAEVMAETLRLWRSGDLSALDQLLLAPLKLADAVTYQQMFIARNQAWLPQIQAMFGDQQREFILVGLGHLAGPDGVLALLTQAGYKVEPLKR
jgi:uncharacterized protein YbaP (TraB family)